MTYDFVFSLNFVLLFIMHVTVTLVNFRIIKYMAINIICLIIYTILVILLFSILFSTFFLPQLERFDRTYRVNYRTNTRVCNVQETSMHFARLLGSIAHSSSSFHRTVLETRRHEPERHAERNRFINRKEFNSRRKH